MGHSMGEPFLGKLNETILISKWLAFKNFNINILHTLKYLSEVNIFTWIPPLRRLIPNRRAILKESK